jgi:hypothetical protein
VTAAEATALVEQYRDGLHAELALLRQLVALADRQTASTGSRDFEQLSNESDERDRVTRGLVTIEDGLTEIRRGLGRHRALTMSLPAWPDIVRLRQEAADLVARVLSADRESMRLLADAEAARRAALANLEKGETTLAAYRRVLTPPVEHAALVDGRG